MTTLPAPSYVERPILFSGAMVRAILAGTKTQTRRVLTTKHTLPTESGYQFVYGADGYCGLTRQDAFRFSAFPLGRMRYGVPGDRLWVRETWCPVPGGGGDCWLYRADMTAEQVREEATCKRLMKAGANHWRPSIHMPRRASRILLEITDVRVQRLQEITGEDARAEGVQYPVSVHDCPAGKCKPLFRLDLMERAVSWGIFSTPKRRAEREPTHDDMSRLYFSALWDEINGKRPGCSWEANPWVWTVSFKRLQP